jgi:hypothetical protein
MGKACVKQYALTHRSLARVNVGNDADIADGVQCSCILLAHTHSSLNDPGCLTGKEKGGSSFCMQGVALR